MRVGAGGAPSQPMSAPRVFFSLPLIGRQKPHHVYSLQACLAAV